MYYRGIAWLYAVVAITIGLVQIVQSDPLLRTLQWQHAFTLFLVLHLWGVVVYLFCMCWNGGLESRSEAGIEPEFPWTGPVDVHTQNVSSLNTYPRNGQSGPAMAAQIEDPEAAIFPSLGDDIVRFGIWPKIYGSPSRFTGRTQQLATIRSVCRSWRRWTESTQEYRDFRESRVEDQWQNDPELRGMDYSCSN